MRSVVGFFAIGIGVLFACASIDDGLDAATAATATLDVTVGVFLAAVMVTSGALNLIGARA